MNHVKPTCPNCGSAYLEHFYTVRNVPSNSCICLDSIDEAINYPTGNISLCFCQQCTFIHNSLFDISLVEYSDRYQDQQIFSSTFRGFLDKIVDKLIRKYNLKNKTILEIGCGKGDFLKEICLRGNNRGIGIDPCGPRNVSSSKDEANIRFYREFYCEEHRKFTPDLICCRHTLEHIDKTCEFIRLLRSTITSINTKIFFEVPNAKLIIDNNVFQDIYYEHCSYFTEHSLRYLFENNGFAIEEIEYAYNQQYLLLYAGINTEERETDNQMDNKPISSADISNFTIKTDGAIDYWKHLVVKLLHEEKKVIIWGSGSKCVSFLAAIGASKSNLTIVDINPMKHNRFSPGLCMPIVSPDSIASTKTDAVIVMNGIYIDEISRQVESYGQNPDIFSL